MTTGNKTGGRKKGTPNKNGQKSDKRQPDGTFAPGNPGGPGRPEGSLNKATLAVQELLDGVLGPRTQTPLIRYETIFYGIAIGPASVTSDIGRPRRKSFQSGLR